MRARGSAQPLAAAGAARTRTQPLATVPEDAPAVGVPAALAAVAAVVVVVAVAAVVVVVGGKVVVVVVVVVVAG